MEVSKVEAWKPGSLLQALEEHQPGSAGLGAGSSPRQVCSVGQVRRAHPQPRSESRRPWVPRHALS